MKNTKKILLVSSSFFPELSPRSFRATELAKEFSRQGHTVKVLTKYRDCNYNSLFEQNPFEIKVWSKPVKKAIVRPTRFFRVKRVIKRLTGILFEFPAIKEMFSIRKFLRYESGHDLVISFAVPYPVHWGVAWARSNKHLIGKIWVADCGDPFMFARLDRFKKPFYFKYLEKYFCRKCNFITVPFNEMRNQFYSEFKPKILIIPQGFNFNEIRVHHKEPENRNPVFIYAGSIIPGKRDLKLLLDFLCTLERKFLFIIYTNQFEWFNYHKEILGERVSIRKYIDRLDLIYEMSKADFLINVDTSYDINSNVEAVPSKLIDYALSNRPILNLNSSWLDEKAVLEFLDGNYTKKRVIDKDNYDISKVSSMFLALCNTFNRQNEQSTY